MSSNQTSSNSEQTHSDDEKENASAKDRPRNKNLKCQENQENTPAKSSPRTLRTRTPSSKAVENLVTDMDYASSPTQSPNSSPSVRRSSRKKTISSQYTHDQRSARKKQRQQSIDEEPEFMQHDSDTSDFVDKPTELFEENQDVAGQHLFTFKTPKKRDGMAIMASNTPKTPKLMGSSRSTGTPKTAPRRLTTEMAKKATKTPHRVRSTIKKGCLVEYFIVNNFVLCVYFLQL